QEADSILAREAHYALFAALTLFAEVSTAAYHVDRSRHHRRGSFWSMICLRRAGLTLKLLFLKIARRKQISCSCWRRDRPNSSDGFQFLFLQWRLDMEARERSKPRIFQIPTFPSPALRKSRPLLCPASTARPMRISPARKPAARDSRKNSYPERAVFKMSLCFARRRHRSC